MSNYDIIVYYEETHNIELLDEMTERNLHTVRELCEQGDFAKAKKWIEEREGHHYDVGRF